MQGKYRVLFVCLGNICRSPMAHGVFRAKLAKAGLSDQVEVESAGIGGWHVGNPPDERAQAESERRGYDLSDLRARKVTRQDFATFDRIIGMDDDNMRDLKALAQGKNAERISLFMSYAPQFGEKEIPDPYYGGEDGFTHALDLVEAASDGLLDAVRNDLQSRG